MKPFEAHVKQWQIVTHRTKKARGRRGLPLVKWVKVVLYVPTGSWKLARSIGARLSRVMSHTGHSVSVGVDLAYAAEERDAAHEYLRRWQDWSTKLHRKLGLIDDLTLPDDTKGRSVLGKLVIENGNGCRMGVFCSEHNFIHGFEAEHLRGDLEKLMARSEEAGQVSENWGGDAEVVRVSLLQELLDKVNARDSLAFLEIQKRLEEDDEEEAANAG